jgi:hypothetical protein
MTESSPKRRPRISIRALMIVVALCALFLAPLIWLARRSQEEMRLALAAEALARDEAVRAREVAQFLAAQVKSPTTQTAPSPPSEKVPGELWAALSVNHTVSTPSESKDLFVEFTLVNDGPNAIDPRLGDSRILVNGKELADSVVIFANAPKDARFSALPPGDHLQFLFALGDYFKEPGIYRVSWQGRGFQSAEIVIRVLPDRKR